MLCARIACNDLTDPLIEKLKCSKSIFYEKMMLERIEQAKKELSELKRLQPTKDQVDEAQEHFVRGSVEPDDYEPEGVDED